MVKELTFSRMEPIMRVISMLTMLILSIVSTNQIDLPTEEVSRTIPLMEKAVKKDLTIDLMVAIRMVKDSKEP